MGLPADSTRQGRVLFWLALAGLVCLFPFFFIGGPGWSDGPLIRAAWNLGHPLFFALLTLAIRPWRFLSGWKLWALTTAAVLLLGLSVEFGQSLDGRNIDARDMFRNLTGLWAVLALQPRAGFTSPLAVRTWLARIAAGLLLAVELTLVTGVAVQQFQVNRLLPDLYDFHHENPGQFWQGDLARSTGNSCGPFSDHALTIALTTRRYSGASLNNLPSDWRGFDRLTFVLWNPQSYAVPLTLRINDLAHDEGSNAYHDRFNRGLRIEPGLNRIHQNLSKVISAPRDREMDMTRIRRLMFFTSGLNEPGHLCLTGLRLENSDDAPTGMD